MKCALVEDMRIYTLHTFPYHLKWIETTTTTTNGKTFQFVYSFLFVYIVTTFENQAVEMNGELTMLICPCCSKRNSLYVIISPLLARTAANINLNLFLSLSDGEDFFYLSWFAHCYIGYDMKNG